MGFRSSILAAIALSIIPTFQLSSQDLPLNDGALFLVFPVGAQAVGMGQTATAAAGRGEAAFWNPAGLATIGSNEFTLHSATLVAGPTSVVSAYFPSRGIGVLGGAVYLVDYGDEEHTDATGTIGRISARNIELLASYATALSGSVVFGLSYKLVQFRVDCSGDCRGVPAGQGTTHALDLGGQFRIDAGGPLRVGVVVRNVGFRLQVRLRPPTGGALDQAFDVKLAADVDSPWGQVGQSETRLGLDIGYQRLVRVRAGYAFVRDGLSGPSLGLGVESGSLGVDLARVFLTNSDLQAASPTFFSFRVTF